MARAASAMSLEFGHTAGAGFADTGRRVGILEVREASLPTYHNVPYGSHRLRIRFCPKEGRERPLDAARTSAIF